MTYRLTALALVAAGAIQMASAMPASAKGSVNGTSLNGLSLNGASSTAVVGNGLHPDDAGVLGAATGSAALRRFDAGAAFDLNAVEAIGMDMRADTADRPLDAPELIALPAVQRP